MVFIGAADKFLIPYLPALIILGAFGVVFAWQYCKNSWQKYAFILFALALLYSEAVSATNKNFIEYPDYGVAKLDRYFEEEFKGAVSGAIPESENTHLTKIIRDFEKRQNAGEEKLYAIIYNDNVALSTLEWVFYRRFFYHSTPTFFVENWNHILSSPETAQQFKDFTLYFVQSTEHTLLNSFKRDKTTGIEFETSLVEQGFAPERSIVNKDGIVMFKIYKFTL